VLDPPREDRLAALRLTAESLGVPWPDGMSYPEFIHSLDPRNPIHTAVIFHAAGVMGGARYESFEGPTPTDAKHSAIAAYYAHVTAPLRRLADRYALDLLVELAAGRKPAGPIASVLHALPAVMSAAERTQHTLERRMVDLAEARLLAGRVGETFDALVIRARDDSATVQIADPAVRADVPAPAFPAPVELGERLTVRLEAVDTAAGAVRFLPV
jgi:exoribonuclease R